MGGKGQKRREKNYRAVHGDHSRLPPPPDPSALDALPSKLRTLIALTSPLQGSEKVSTTAEKRNKAVGSSNEQVSIPGSAPGGTDEHMMMPQHIDKRNDKLHNGELKKKNKKRKRKKVNDLRFEATLGELGAASSKKRERKKKYLEARKKKNKKGKADERVDFPGHEEIRFGEVVQAPPKLDAIPKCKALKTVLDASRERLRMQAVEAYRNRKGWVSRPGINLPPPATIAPSL